MGNREFKQVSDQELAAMLASLKQDIAAPPDFHAKILGRIAAEPALTRPRPGSAWLRALLNGRAWLLPAAATALIAVILWQGSLSRMPLQEIGPLPSLPKKEAAPQLAQAHPRKQVEKPVLAYSSDAPARTDSAVSKAVDPPQQAAIPVHAAPSVQAVALVPSRQASLPNASSSAAQFGSSSGIGSSAAGASAAGMKILEKPTVIVVESSPTPLAKNLSGNSEVRRNKFLASKGEYALILFETKTGGNVLVEVFDRLGRRVTLLLDQPLAPGLHELRWSGYDEQGQMSPSGIYLVRIKTGDFDERHKVVLVR